ncbi:hypothetical protein J4460_03285 [Candidatus Woesearchaeota archaeon]|nr:MAG: hypothetical protein QS99_C0008G0028 [archaeon GW2011_AR4]MBS3129671.1 hypothetical protein [Candidatus Woesearchaeota archaeon]HIH38775.1 hypothetical protein [Candidatus Woesearchaeota archaeon]HIH49191.1 hypothetical protein [Candidatus Woesearchaeota archaeon]HIJ03333.1 hypothetical protein [Candidatus Woesearchaeota archaeon]
MVSKTGEYKGHKTISLLEEGVEVSDKYPPFSFGVKKAKLILENIEDIKKFVEENT